MTYIAENTEEDVDDGIGRADAAFDPDCEREQNLLAHGNYLS
jgi:hypothetical protein